MSNFIQWTGPAFRELEKLPESLAFEIIRKTDLLANFPELGADLGSRFQELTGLRQLVIDRKWRVVYEFEPTASTIWILAIQNCRQNLPSSRKLRKRKLRL